MAAKICEKNENANPAYSRPLNLPHQSMMRRTVLNMPYASFAADETAQFFAPMCACHMSL